MELYTKESFDSDNDQTNRQNAFEDTLRSDHSSRMDFSKHGIFVERTLALIKPDAVNKANEIETNLLNHGFTVLQVCLVCVLIERIIFNLETTYNINS
jgi:nucleoside diphosphate kinase